jgi:hypothetical protein
VTIIGVVNFCSSKCLDVAGNINCLLNSYFIQLLRLDIIKKVQSYPNNTMMDGTRVYHISCKGQTTIKNGKRSFLLWCYHRRLLLVLVNLLVILCV